MWESWPGADQPARADVGAIECAKSGFVVVEAVHDLASTPLHRRQRISLFCDALGKLHERRAHLPAWEPIIRLDQAQRAVAS